MLNKNYKAKKAVNPVKLAKSLVEDQDGSLFLRNQVRQEKEMSSKLSLRAKTLERLQSRHSISAISRFFDKHAMVIEKQHYLYELPAYNPLIRDATFQPNWSEDDKTIYTLDSYAYCLFTRKEYKAALSANIDKGSITLFPL